MQPHKPLFAATASCLTNLPLYIRTCCVLPCTLRDVRLDSTNVYSPWPLKVKFTPSNVMKWGSPKADAGFKRRKRKRNKQKPQHITPLLRFMRKKKSPCGAPKTGV